DFGTGQVRCPIGTTKTGEPLRFPFGYGSPLERLLRTQERGKRGQYVFHHGGKKIKNYSGAWRTAMKAMGDSGYGMQYDPVTGAPYKVLKRFHDLRHSFAQHATDAGMPEAQLLALGGWKTRAMLDRYRIASDEAKRAAVAQRDEHVAA